MAAPPPTHSVRYLRLWEATQKALTQSRSLELSQVIQECYGDDANILDSSYSSSSNVVTTSSNVLQGSVAQLLDQLTDGVMEDMKSYFVEQHVEEKLLKLEKALFQLERAADLQKQAEQWDATSAQQALKDAKLPEGVKIKDLMSYRAHQTMLEEKQVMQTELHALQQEVADLEGQTNRKKTQVQATVGTISATGKQLEKSADICSLLS